MLILAAVILVVFRGTDGSVVSKAGGMLTLCPTVLDSARCKESWSACVFLDEDIKSCTSLTVEFYESPALFLVGSKTDRWMGSLKYWFLTLTLALPREPPHLCGFLPAPLQLAALS